MEECIESPVCIDHGVAHYKTYGNCNHVYFHCMSNADRENVDRYLVAIHHPLAFEPGTNEIRYKALVKELATKRTTKGG